MADVTRILSAIDAGDARAAEQLLPLVYDELRKLAAARMANERPDHTLDATALVHEAYLRLVLARSASEGETDSLARASGYQFANRRHFFAAAAEAMRRILVENARRKARIKHGGELQRVEFDEIAASGGDNRLLALDEALTRLAGEDSNAAEVVKLRHFAGLGHEQIAESLGITVYEARQKWAYARAWLRDALAE